MAQVEPVSNAGAAAQLGSTQTAKTAGSGTSSTSSFGTVGELRAKAPKLYKAIEQGIAINIINEEEKHNKRMKKLYREMNQPQS